MWLRINLTNTICNVTCSIMYRFTKVYRKIKLVSSVSPLAFPTFNAETEAFLNFIFVHVFLLQGLSF